MNKKFYAILLFLGLVLFSYNYWGDFGKISVLNFFATETEETDYSWLSTYENESNKILRKPISEKELESAFKAQEIVQEDVYDERIEFINASYKASCVVFSAKGAFTQELEDFTVKIFEDAGFPAKNKKKMQALIDKYKDDNAYVKEILKASLACSCEEDEALSFSEYQCVK